MLFFKSKEAYSYDWVIKLVVNFIKFSAIILLFIFSLKFLQFNSKVILEENAYSVLRESLNSPLRAFSGAILSSGLVMSGSPVATIGIGFRSIEMISDHILALIILGSRLAPNTILFLTGLITIISTKRSLSRSFDVAILEFITNCLVILFALPIFFLIQGSLNISLITGGFKTWQLEALTKIEKVFNPFFHLIYNLIGENWGFLFALLLLVGTIKLFDTNIKLIEVDEVLLEEKKLIEYIKEWRNPLVGMITVPKLMIKYAKNLFFNIRYLFNRNKPQFKLITLLQNPYFAFLAGFLVTLVSFSLTISVSLLLPLYMYGKIGPKTLVPYILGANISTYADSLLFAVISGSNEALVVVIYLIFSVFSVVGILMVFIKLIIAMINLITRLITKNRLAFILVIILIWLLPIIGLFV